MSPTPPGVRCSTGSRPRHWSLRRGRRDAEARRPSGCPSRPPTPLTELARSCHTTVSTVLQAGWAQVLMWLTGQHDVAFGTAVSGRPTDVPGADSMVGLLINTVPVRASITAATTIADLLGQLQQGHNDTLEHDHLALNEIHHATGHEQLFDTLLVYENYPIDTAALTAVPDWPSPTSPAGSTTTTPCRWRSYRAGNWGCGSNSTPMCSTRPASTS